MMHEKMTVEERLQRLETENRFFRWGAVAALVIISGTLLLGGAVAQTSEPKVIEAEGFRLVDETGGTRASLYVIEGEPGLVMWDENGKPRARLGLLEGDPKLTMYDENVKQRLALDLLEGEPGLVMWDEDSKLRVALGLVKDGPKIALLDNKERQIWPAP